MATTKSLFKSKMTQIMRSPFAVINEINQSKNEPEVKTALEELGIEGKVTIDDLMVLDNSEKSVFCKVRKVKESDLMALDLIDNEAARIAAISDFMSRTYTNTKGTLYVKEPVSMSIGGYIDAMYAKADYAKTMAAKEEAYSKMFNEAWADCDIRSQITFANLKAAHPNLSEDEIRHILAMVG